MYYDFFFKKIVNFLITSFFTNIVIFFLEKYIIEYFTRMFIHKLIFVYLNYSIRLVFISSVLVMFNFLLVSQTLVFLI